LLSLQNLAGSAADTLGNRVLRFSVASFVPIVGGSLSEAFSTVRSCLGILRSTMGVFGIGACAAIILPPLLTCVVWNICLSLCHMSAEMFELRSLISLLKAAQSVIKCLIGILCAGVLFAIVAVTVVTMASGNV
jgi:stage III sporulation protein AE